MATLTKAEKRIPPRPSLPSYLGNLVVSFIENWDTIQKELKKAPEAP